MNLQQAVQILKRHNEWRRSNDDSIKMAEPKTLGIAIDVIVQEYISNDELINKIADLRDVFNWDGDFNNPNNDNYVNTCAIHASPYECLCAMIEITKIRNKKIRL